MSLFATVVLTDFLAAILAPSHVGARVWGAILAATHVGARVWGAILAATHVGARVWGAILLHVLSIPLGPSPTIPH